MNTETQMTHYETYTHPADATSPRFNMSPKYNHFTTRGIADGIIANGWEQSNSWVRNSSKNAGHQLHTITLRNPNKAIADPRGNGRSIYPTVLLRNSSDGSCAFSATHGLFVQVCSNGLCYSYGDLGSFRARHTHYKDSTRDITTEAIIATLADSATKADAVADDILAMGDTILTSDQVQDLASRAHDIRWPNEGIDETRGNVLLTIHRAEDGDSSLWSVFNRVQENLVTGGFRRLNSTRNARPVVSSDQSRNINLGLWNLATGFIAGRN